MSTLSTRTDDGILVVTIKPSTLDDDDVIQQVSQELSQITSNSATEKLLLDFQNVEFMTSGMVGQLFAQHSQCKANNVRLMICGVHGLVHKILGIVRLDDFIDIVGDVDVAKIRFAQPFDRHATFEKGDRINALRGQAEAGDADAQFELAVCYENGEGVAFDSEEASKWFERAAESGHAEAQYRLGVACAYGINRSQDYDQAIHWYRESAEQGNAHAQYALGMSYYYGIALPDDRKTAIEWYRKAAEQGHKKAQDELERAESE